MVSLDAIGFLQRMVVFVPGDFGFRNSENLALNLSSVDANKVDFAGVLDKLRILSHDGDDRLTHLTWTKEKVNKTILLA